MLYRTPAINSKVAYTCSRYGYVTNDIANDILTAHCVACKLGKRCGTYINSPM